MCILVKKLADMVGKQNKTPQLSIFDTTAGADLQSVPFTFLSIYN